VHTTKTIVRPTVEEVCQFLTHVEGCGRPGAAPLLPLWRLAACTGLRRSEALGLAWDEVQLDGDPATVSVVRGLHQDGGFYIGRPKSRESKRTVGLDPTTAALLADLRERSRGLHSVRVGSDAPGRMGGGCRCGAGGVYRSAMAMTSATTNAWSWRLR
jgi:integrase